MSVSAIESRPNIAQELVVAKGLRQVADDPRLQCAGANIIARVSGHQYGGNLSATTRQPVRFRSGERKNSSAEANTSAANPIERINLLIASRTDSSSSTMATILLFFGT